MKTIMQWNCQAFSNISYLRKRLSISEAEFVTDCYTYLMVTHSKIRVHARNRTTQYVSCYYLKCSLYYHNILVSAIAKHTL